MKNLILILTVLAAFQTQAASNQSSLKAELPSDQSLIFLPTAGFTVFSSIGRGIRGDMSNTEGFAGGMLMDVQSEQRPLKFETGVLFVQEGTSYGNDVVVTNNYLMIPAIAKFNLGNIGWSTWNFRAGAAPAYLISASQKSTSGLSRDRRSQSNEFDVQGILGIGAAFNINERRAMTVDFSYMRGMLDFAKLRSGAEYNQGFMLTGGMMF